VFVSAVDPDAVIDGLIEVVKGLNLNVREKNSLLIQLQVARTGERSDQPHFRTVALHAFIDEVAALTQSGRLEPAKAQDLMAAARRIIGAP
jgi:hypothetical protein